jgi:hypothetical protein
MEEYMPPHVLEAILGLLNRESLGTARLVSRTFCAAASVNVCSVSVRSRSKASSPHRFPRLEHVTLHHTAWPETLAKLHPSFRDLVTTVLVSNPLLLACHQSLFPINPISQTAGAG